MFNLYGLKYFADAARFGSMTKAAELNYLTRPAISIAIQKLEDEMGTPLLNHKKRSFELTSAGLALFKKSESILLQAQDLKTGLKLSKDLIAGDFNIGSSRTLATFNFPKGLVKLRKQYPLVDFKIHLANSSALVQKLENREVDMAYFIGDDHLDEFKSVVVSRGHFCLVKPKYLDERSLQYAISERRPETERARTLFERKFGEEMPVFAEVHSWDAIWTWVNEGLCGGLVPDFLFTSKPLRQRNCEVVIAKVFPYEVKAMFSKARAQHPIVKSFLEYY